MKGLLMALDAVLAKLSHPFKSPLSEFSWYERRHFDRELDREIARSQERFFRERDRTGDAPE